jgi:hypothetical protein
MIVFSKLADVLASSEFENTGVARIASMDEKSEGLRVQLHVRFDAADGAAQTWEFLCGDVRTYDLRYGPIESVELVSQHPLLIPYTARWASLNFVGVPMSPSSVVGGLWEVHREVTEGWLSFDAFLNAGLKTTDLLASGGGILGEGPRPCVASELEE